MTSARDKLIRAQQLLADAGSIIRDTNVAVGRRSSAHGYELPDAVAKLKDQLTQHKTILETVKAERDSANVQLERVNAALSADDTELDVIDKIEGLQRGNASLLNVSNQVISLRRRLTTALGDGVLDDDALVDAVKELVTEHAAMLTERNATSSLRQRLMTVFGDGPLDDDLLVDKVRALVATLQVEITPKFTVGDWVRLTTTPDTPLRVSVVTVSYGAYAIYTLVDADDRVWGSYHGADLERWKPPHKFKVGDWVQIQGVGPAYKVIEIDRVCHKLEVVNGLSMWRDEHDLTAATAQPAEPAFRADDLVTVDGLDGVRRIAAITEQHNVRLREPGAWAYEPTKVRRYTGDSKFAIGDKVRREDGIGFVGESVRTITSMVQDNNSAWSYGVNDEYLRFHESELTQVTSNDD